MSYEISKEFEFDYGHRVHNQVLDQEYSCDAKCKCRHLHGHRGKIVAYISADKLDSRGMVTDFNHLNKFKKWLDDTFDHRFILDVKDPYLVQNIVAIYGASILPWLDEQLEDKGFVLCEQIKYPRLKPHLTFSNMEQEINDSIVIVKFNPTSENLAYFFYKELTYLMAKLFMSELRKTQVSKIEFYETPKSKSTYHAAK